MVTTTGMNDKITRQRIPMFSHTDSAIAPSKDSTDEIISDIQSKKRERSSDETTNSSEYDASLRFLAESAAISLNTLRTRVEVEEEEGVLKKDVDNKAKSITYAQTFHAKNIGEQDNKRLEGSNLGSLLLVSSRNASTALDNLEYYKRIALKSSATQSKQNCFHFTTELKPSPSVQDVTGYQDETYAAPTLAESFSMYSAHDSEQHSANLVVTYNQQLQSLPMGQILPSSISLGHPINIIAPSQEWLITGIPQSSNEYINDLGPLLYFPTDDGFLTEQQIFIRKQIEFFEVSLDDVGKTTSGRKHPSIKNQVGIQCRHCAIIPVRYRERGAVYFPARLLGIYQAAQNIAGSHMTQLCKHIDHETKETLKTNKQSRCLGNGGKKYWAETAKAQGIAESLLESCLCYARGNLCGDLNP